MAINESSSPHERLMRLIVMGELHPGPPADDEDRELPESKTSSRKALPELENREIVEVGTVEGSDPTTAYHLRDPVVLTRQPAVSEGRETP